MIPYFAVAALASVSSGLGGMVRSMAQKARGVGPGGRQLNPWTPFDFLAVAILVAFSGLRYGVGTDYQLYSAIYSRLNGLGWSDALRESPQEVGFTGLIVLLGHFSKSPDLLFWTTSLITVSFFYAAIKSLSPHPAFSTLLFILLGYYLVPLNLVRQGIALALNMYSLKYLNKSRKKFLAINLIATVFHVSVLPVVVIQLALRKTVPTKKLLFLVFVGSVVLVIGLGASDWIRSAAGLLNPRYETYLSVTAASESAAGLGTYVLVATRMLVVLYSLSLPLPEHLKPLQTLLIISIPLQACAIVAPPVGRLEYYFSVLAVVLLPAQIESQSNRFVHRTALIIFSILYFAAHLYFFGGLLPYRMIPFD